jgi:hypothetical protein
MKVTKSNAGNYIVTLHNHSYSLEKMFGDANWRLYNKSFTEINCAETKSGMLEVMRGWSQERTSEYAYEDTCYYA